MPTLREGPASMIPHRLRQYRHVPSLVGLVALGVSFAVPALATDSWYAARITGGDTPFRVEHFWAEGGKVRMDTVIRAQPFTTIVSGEYYTVIDPVKKTALSIRVTPSALKLMRETRGQRPFAREADRMVAAGAEQVGSEKIGNRPTKHYRVSNSLASSEAWVTDDDFRLPMRLIRYDRTSGSTRREDFVDWARDLALPDAFFAVPAGTEVERLEYEEYAERARDGTSQIVPILVPELLHGRE